MGNEAVHLLFAMNRWEMKKQLVELLASGTNVVCDRYAYSGVAYSVAKVSRLVIYNWWRHGRTLKLIDIMWLSGEQNKY